MAFEQELDIYLRSRFTLMVLVTPEEERALESVKQVCDRAKRPCLSWDVADGFNVVTNWHGTIPTARDPLSALEQVDKADGDGLFVLKDFHDCWSNPQFKRKLRSVSQRLKFSKKSILITAPSGKIPVELKDEAVILEYPLPKNDELETVLGRLTQTPGVKINSTKLGKEKLIQAALGLTASQAQRVFAKAIVSNGRLDDRDISLVTEEKKQIIRESQALEFYAVHETPADVGGLGVLKDWLRLRERAFSQEARNYGLPAPKGLAINAASRIREIATLAYSQGIKVRWFDFNEFKRKGQPSGGEKGDLEPVNACEVLPRIVNIGTLKYLYSTVENKQSLVFSGLEKRNKPGVLFTADSDLKFNFQHQSPALSMIVTTPHHGSENNKNAYRKVIKWHKNPGSIIWVRSDGKYKCRPGNSFLTLIGQKLCTICRPPSNQTKQAVKLSHSQSGLVKWIWHPNVRTCQCK